MKLLGRLCGEPDAQPSTPVPKTAYAVERLENPPAESTNDLPDQTEPIVGFHVSATCPSCRHDTTDLFTLASVSAGGSGLAGLMTRVGVFGLLGSEALYVGQAQVLGAAARPWQRIVARPEPMSQEVVGLIRCRCSGSHPDSDGKVGMNLGCGSMWLVNARLTLSRPSNGALLVPVPKNRQDRYWAGAEAISNGAAGASDSARDIAAKWQAGLTALLGLAVIGAALSRDTILGLSGTNQWTIGIAAAFALVANGLALFHTSLAAAGLPRVNRKTVTRDVIDWDIAPLRQAKASAEAMLTALVCAGVAILSTAVAVAVLTFAPPAEGPTEVRLTVRAASGTTSACGTVTPTNTGLHFKPSAEGRREHDYPLATVVRIEPC